MRSPGSRSASSTQPRSRRRGRPQRAASASGAGRRRAGGARGSSGGASRGGHTAPAPPPTAPTALTHPSLALPLDFDASFRVGPIADAGLFAADDVAQLAYYREQ